LSILNEIKKLTVANKKNQKVGSMTRQQNYFFVLKNGVAFLVDKWKFKIAENERMGVGIRKLDKLGSTNPVNMPGNDGCEMNQMHKSIFFVLPFFYDAIL